MLSFDFRIYGAHYGAPSPASPCCLCDLHRHITPSGHAVSTYQRKLLHVLARPCAATATIYPTGLYLLGHIS